MTTDGRGQQAASDGHEKCHRWAKEGWWEAWDGEWCPVAIWARYCPVCGSWLSEPLFDGTVGVAHPQVPRRVAEVLAEAAFSAKGVVPTPVLMDALVKGAIAQVRAEREAASAASAATTKGAE
jgi:hypothetical protein